MSETPSCQSIVSDDLPTPSIQKDQSILVETFYAGGVIENRYHLQPDALVGKFGSENIPLAPEMEAFISAVVRELPLPDLGLKSDLRLVHADEHLVRAIPRGYRHGKTVFGNGTSSGEEIFVLNTARLRMAETVLLHNAVFSPQSASVMRYGAGFYEASLLNYGAEHDAFDKLVAYDPIYQYGDDHKICFAPAAISVQRLDCLAIPVCGTGFHNYGHFLFDGLPLVFLLSKFLRGTSITLIGPELSEWQRDILAALGLGGRYLALQQPTMFSRLITSNQIAQHVSYPTRLVRPMADFLRFRLAVSTGFGRRVFISRSGDTLKRLMTNRDEVHAVFCAMGFEIVVPEQMTFAEQVRLFAGCEIIAGESGAGMANVIFCDPGTKVIEIQPEHFFEGWIRATSMIMALEWNVFFAKSAPSADSGIAFTVDTNLLKQALQTVISA